MNFDNMPELHWELGYMYVWVVYAGILIVAVVLMWWYGYIKMRYGWLENLRLRAEERRRKKQVSEEVLTAANQPSRKGH